MDLPTSPNQVSFSDALIKLLNANVNLEKHLDVIRSKQDLLNKLWSIEIERKLSVSDVDVNPGDLEDLKALCEALFEISYCVDTKSDDHRRIMAIYNVINTRIEKFIKPEFPLETRDDTVTPGLRELGLFKKTNGNHSRVAGGRITHTNSGYSEH